MKLDPIKLRKSDFSVDEGSMELAEQLAALMNPFFDKLVLTINKNLSVEDNLPFEFIFLEVTVDSNGIPTSPRIIKTSLKSFKGFICLNAFNLSANGVFPASSPFISYSTVDGTSIKVEKISGLPASTNYRLTLLGVS